MLLKLLYKRQHYRRRTLYLGHTRLTALIADSFVKHLIGLMFRKSLPKRECMLFKFAFSARYGIWMHNMRFPIDIAWLSADLLVVDTVKNAKPCNGTFDCKTYHPRSKAKYVLETNAGMLSKCGIKIGKRIRLK